MLTSQENNFIDYWYKNRLKEKHSLRYVYIGGCIGLLMGMLIFLALTSGWYQRADMIANSRFNPVVFLIATLCMALFIGWFYRKYKWEQREQLYLELRMKQQKSYSEMDAATEPTNQSKE